jgi:AcrR family transcriptional regulator
MAIDASVDPRVLRTRDAVLGAARDVLREEGWEQVTVRRVAERSGYARTTLYRHWPQRLDLLRDLIREDGRLTHSTPTGDLRADLTAELEAFRVALTESGLGRVVIAIGQQARDDAELAELNRTMRAEGSQVLDAIIRDAADRGELPVSIRADVAVAQLVGALLFRYLFEDTEALNPAFVEAVVEQFLARDASQVERPPASLTAGAGR